MRRNFNDSECFDIVFHRASVTADKSPWKCIDLFFSSRNLEEILIFNGITLGCWFTNTSNLRSMNYLAPQSEWLTPTVNQYVLWMNICVINMFFLENIRLFRWETSIFCFAFSKSNRLTISPNTSSKIKDWKKIKAKNVKWKIITLKIIRWNVKLSWNIVWYKTFVTLQII